MRRDGRSRGWLKTGMNTFYPNYSSFGIVMNTVGNLFHQIEEISLVPRTIRMIYQLTAISWLSTDLTMVSSQHNVYILTRPGLTWAGWARSMMRKVKTNVRPVQWSWCDLAVRFGLNWAAASVRVMCFLLPRPTSIMWIQLSRTQQNKLPMSSTWRKYW